MPVSTSRTPPHCEGRRLLSAPQRRWAMHCRLFQNMPSTCAFTRVPSSIRSQSRNGAPPRWQHRSPAMATAYSPLLSPARESEQRGVLPHEFRSVVRSGPAAVPRFLRSGSAAVPQRFRSGSALPPQRFRSGSALPPQRFCSGSASSGSGGRPPWRGRLLRPQRPRVAVGPTTAAVPKEKLYVSGRSHPTHNHARHKHGGVRVQPPRKREKETPLGWFWRVETPSGFLLGRFRVCAPSGPAAMAYLRRVCRPPPPLPPPPPPPPPRPRPRPPSPRSDFAVRRVPLIFAWK